MDEEEKQAALRMPLWLWNDVMEAARKSGWTFSAQVRHELSTIRGKAHVPYMPSPQEPQLSFAGPIQEPSGRKARKSKKAA